ncbi:MAG: GNAT family N-acetyltransferase [Rhodococcus sp. (in: high G+C Gram-positive bacteria)]
MRGIDVTTVHRAAYPSFGDGPILIDLTPREMRRRLTEALSVYVAAMGYPSGTELHRAPMWAEHILRPGWRAVGAVNAEDGPLVAIAYCYSGAPHQWWHQQVRDGMRRAGWSHEDAAHVLTDYVELTELHVSPSVQGHRVGERLLVALMAGRDEGSVLLSTPEVAAEDNRAWRLYRRMGFQDIVRRFHFAGDARPFAVLGSELPLNDSSGHTSTLQTDTNDQHTTEKRPTT